MRMELKHREQAEWEPCAATHLETSGEREVAEAENLQRSHWRLAEEGGTICHHRCVAAGVAGSLGHQLAYPAQKSPPPQDPHLQRSKQALLLRGASAVAHEVLHVCLDEPVTMVVELYFSRNLLLRNLVFAQH